MPRLIPQSNKLVRTVSVLVLFMLALFAGEDASAQRRRRPVQKAPQQQGATNTNTTPTAQTKPQKKNITPLRGGDTPEGSRLTITSDVPLNDYSAYRSGDRYYVEIPDANAPRAQSGLRGRGFEDVQVQKRGDNAVISFKLQPGATARVSQKFNRLDVELSAPGRSTAAVTPTPTSTPATITQPTPRSTPQTATVTPTPAGTGATGQTNQAPTGIPPGAETIPPVTIVQPPDASVSPGVSPEASPLATPPSDVIAQTQPQTEAQPITQPASAAPSSSLGATLARNWLLILIVGLVLASLVLIVAARSRARGAAAATPVRRVSRKERLAARALSSDKSSEASTSEESSAVKSAIVLKPGTLPKAVKIAKVEESPAVAVAEDTKEVEPIAAVDVERVELEVKHLLDGESYDETLIGSSEAETRQLVATELLSALAARNVERRERARAAFVKHDYFDEATLNLRTADAAAERASAARSLGYVADRSATLHLLAALEDEAPEVRRAAVEALAEIGDPSAAEPLQSLLKREKNKKVPKSLIERAISASTAVVEVEDTSTPASVQPVSEQEETTLETAPVVIGEADQPPVMEAMGLTSEAATTAVVEEEEAVSEAQEVEPSVPEITAEELAAAEAAAQREKEEEELERLRAEEEERQRLEAEAEARRAAEEEERRAEAERLEQEERERAAREQAEREEQERLEAEARRKAEEEEAARLKAEEEARLKAEVEAEAARRAEEEARLKAEAEERQRAEEEARRKAEEEERLRVEEEKRLAAEAAAAEEARLKAEEEERLRLEEERRRVEAEEARLAAEAEAERKAEEEARARRQAEEEARLAAETEAEARRKAEEAEAARLRAEEEEEARLKAEAEAEAQRQADEEVARLLAEENARRLAAEEAAAALEAEAISPVEHDVAEPETVEASSPALPFEPAIERNDGSAEGWVEVDIAEPMKASTGEATLEPEAPSEAIVFEPSLESPAVAEEPAPAPVSKEIEYAVTEKGVDIFDENTTVPRAILRRLSSEEPDERASAVIDLARVGGDDSFREINAAFDDPAIEVRNAAARSLFNVHTDRAATFTRALREAPPERRRKIGAALASSGLASEAIGQLMGESREKTYDAFSLLFLMSKAGEVQPLMRAIEEHPNNEVRLAVIKLLALSGQQEILPAFRRLAVRGSLPTEVRSAVMEAIYQLSSQSPTAA